MMTHAAFLPSDPPPVEDSKDLSDHEIARAIVTHSQKELIYSLKDELSPGHASVGKNDSRYALVKQELRRRSPHLYLRAHLGCPGEPEKILVYQVDWITKFQEIPNG